MNRKSNRWHIKPLSREAPLTETRPLSREDMDPGFLINLILNLDLRSIRKYYRGEPDARLFCVDDPDWFPPRASQDWYIKRIKADMRREDEAERQTAINKGTWVPLDFSPPDATMYVLDDYRPVNAAIPTPPPDSTGPFKWATENDNGEPHWIVAKLKDQTGS